MNVPLMEIMNAPLQNPTLGKYLFSSMSNISHNGSKLFSWKLYSEPYPACNLFQSTLSGTPDYFTNKQFPKKVRPYVITSFLNDGLCGIRYCLQFHRDQG